MYSAVALRPASALHSVVNEHAEALDGLCVACRTRGCVTRFAALHGLRIGYQLPRRRPGATRPELIGARRVA